MASVGSEAKLVDIVGSYIARSGQSELPDVVVSKAKHHILDTLAAIVSGSRLKPGQVAIDFVQSQVAAQEAQVIGSQTVSSAVNAAFANAMMGHADETDDAHLASRTHPGCAVVPAALAMSERGESNGMDFLKSVVAGYEIGCRITQAIGIDNIRKKSFCTFSLGGNFGAASAAAAAARLDERQVKYALSYAAHQALAMTYWTRDEEHVEKAYVFGGMPARNGVMAVLQIQSGFTGVGNPFGGEGNFFEPFAPDAQPDLLIRGLGKDFEVMSASIKKYAVGYPIQAPVDGLLRMIGRHGFSAGNVESITTGIDAWNASIVNDRDMPDINLQHLLAVTLLDGGLSFEAAHSFARMQDTAVLDVRKRVKLIKDSGLPRNHCTIEVKTRDGCIYSERITTVHGRPDNPMPTEMVEAKCRELMIPILGEDRTGMLIDRIWNLERLSSMRELRPLLSASSENTEASHH